MNGFKSGGWENIIPCLRKTTLAAFFLASLLVEGGAVATAEGVQNFTI